MKYYIKLLCSTWKPHDIIIKEYIDTRKRYVYTIFYDCYDYHAIPSNHDYQKKDGVKSHRAESDSC